MQLPTVVCELIAISRESSGWLSDSRTRSFGCMRLAMLPPLKTPYHQTMPDEEKPRETSSEIEVKPVYTEADVVALDLPSRLGNPGEFPFTRGIHPTMHRGRLW